ncbi:Tetratricopeptide repeat protein 1 [Cyphellophora attinorum]|uniref:Tetratricopeptide repeat protein 1 n=1 Tax=Cyphellophora attinorum TaxID=1664694 RepID=A0A0N1P2F9_9EURO|nr:Tetratricopeptide repeat protein 1 [Phialophora attinorum]KPI42323.1 Tetratricopeptide repeat protein 1 [Phialophora attinorum]
MAAHRRASSNGDVAHGRFADIPNAVEVPLADGDTVEVHLAEQLDDPTELCQLLGDEKAPKNLWITIALAYAKQSQLDQALSILRSGIEVLPSKDRLNLLSGVAWLQLLKSRQAPRTKPQGADIDVKVKDDYLKDVIATLNDAGRINPSFPPVKLTSGVWSLLRASLATATQTGDRADQERSKNLKDALANFEHVLRTSDNRNMMAMLGKARVLYMQGKYAQALESYQVVLMRMPSMSDPDPRIGIGSCLWQLGMHERASKAWSRSLEVNPDSKVAHALLGVYYLRESNKHPASLPEFDKLYKKAMTEHISKAYKIDKAFPLACAVFASYFLLTNRHDAVEPLARNAIEKTDVVAIVSDGWYLLGRKEHNLDNLETATEYYGRADAARGGPGIGKGFVPAKFAQAQVAIQRGQDYETSKQVLESLTGHRNVEASTLLGILTAEEYFKMQKTLPAVASEGSKEAKDRQQAQSLCLQAIKLLENVQKSWTQAKNKDGSINTSAKKDETVLLYLARLYEQEDPIKSAKYLDEVEQLQFDKIPEDELPEETATDEAKLEILRSNLPPSLLNNRACHYYHFGDYSSARSMLEIAMGACSKLSQKQQAERELAAEGNMHDADVDDTDVDALLATISYNLGRTYEVLGLEKNARETYDMLLSRHPDYTEAKARLAFMDLVESPRERGPKAISKLYAEESGNIDVRALMGWFYHGSKKKTPNVSEDSEYRQYKHTLQNHDKHDLYSLTGMGNIHLNIAREMPRNNDAEKEKRSRMYVKAYEFFDKVLQLDPKNAFAAQGIAIMLCDDKRSYSEALQIFARVKDTVRDVNVLTNLGHIYTELRQYPKAIENYNAAQQLDRSKQNPHLLACLSRAHLLKAKVERSILEHITALEYMKEALDATPDSPHLRFNVAFIQFQIATIVTQAKETDRSLVDVESAIKGLDEAIATLEEVAQVKAPPYHKQLERARGGQAEFERNNQEKLVESRKRREEEQAKKDALKAELRRKEQEQLEAVEAERRKMQEESERRGEQARAEAAAREALEYTDDEETGDRIKRKEKQKRDRASGKNRKRKAQREVEDGFIEDDEDEGASGRSVSRTPFSGDSDRDGEVGGEAAPPKKKRRRLERKGGAVAKKARSAPAPKKTNSKYKSDERIIDSDDSDEEEAAPTPVTDADEDMPDAVASINGVNGNGADGVGEDEDGDDSDAVRKPRPTPRKQQRLIADDDDEDEES